MTYDEFIRENSCEYKGYVIAPGSISKDGDTRWITYNPLGATNEEVFAAGKAIIDKDERAMSA